MVKYLKWPPDFLLLENLIFQVLEVGYMSSPNSHLRKADLKCGWCGGRGKDKNSGGKCRVCGGSGIVKKHPDSRRCSSCAGTGEEPHIPGTPTTPHRRCGGSGWVEPS